MTSRNEGKAEGRGHVYQASGDQHIVEHHHYAPEWLGPDSVRQPLVGRPPTVLRDRTAEMDRLRTAVGPGVGNGIYVLHGLGGCGKTAVAFTIFQYAVADAGRVGLWVNASDPASLRAGMLAVAADRGATDGELMGARSGLRPAADLVWQYLDSSQQPWLLVIDNADTPAILRDGGWLRTSPAATVVVTSRRAGAHWWPGVQLLHFGVLPREDAAQVLRDLAPGTGTAEEAAAVADRLGRLPLALILGGGFLAHQVIESWTLADYRRKLDSGCADLDPIDLIDQGSDSAREHDPRHLVSRTWQLSLDALSEQGLPEAAALLRLLACWASDPLPLFLLSGAEQPDLPASRVESGLRGLLDQSLTELVPGTVRCLRTHGVLLDSVARSIGPVQREQTATIAAELLARYLPELPDHGPQDSRMILLAPHVLAYARRVVEWRLADEAIDAAADCAQRLIIAIHRSGGFAAALILARDAIQLLYERLGSDHVRTIRLQQRVGRALFRLGRFEESETIQRQILEDYERLLGPDAPETLDSEYQLICSLRGTGKIQEAFARQKKVTTTTVERFGNLHPYSLESRSDLLDIAGTPLSAEEADSIVAGGPSLIDDCYQVLGENNNVTLLTELNYAWALDHFGRSAEALPYVKRVHTERFSS